MSSYVVDGSSLSAVADAIREKGETSAQLVFPTGFVDAIEAIDTGGGGGGGTSDVETGTYTPSSDVTAASVSIPHSLGAKPDFIIAVADEFEADASWTDYYLANSYASITNFINTSSDAKCYQWSVASCPGRTTLWQSTDYASDISKFADASAFKIPYYSTQHKLKAGITYRYVVGKYPASST